MYRMPREAMSTPDVFGNATPIYIVEVADNVLNKRYLLSVNLVKTNKERKAKWKNLGHFIAMPQKKNFY